MEEGLVVPVIKKADEKGLAQVTGEGKELADKAVESRLRLEELEGGTFTLINLGCSGLLCQISDATKGGSASTVL